MRRPIAALLAALALLVAGPAAAEERILRFFSDVAVQKQHGALEVAETIRVRSEGDQIRRGIFRDFPTRYTDSRGREVRVGFEVRGVTRDGKDEPYSIESIDNGERVRIGDADVLLRPGIHEYRIRYRTTRQVGFFDGFDELYWNATGTGWAFPIDVAEARILLPEPVPFGQRALYTGTQGATGTGAAVVSERPGEIVFRTTAPLGPYEGLTVAAAWPKGVVVPPPPPSARALFLHRYAPPIAALALLAALGLYYFIAWARAGRGPRAGTIVPLFAPPDGMTAASLRYVWKMGFDNRAFAAALVDLGVRGKLRLVESEGDGWFSAPKSRIERVTPENSDLPPPERAMFAALLGSRDRLEMDNKNHTTFSNARRTLEGGLEAAYLGTLFHRNRHWAVAGLALIGVALTLLATILVATPLEAPPLGFALTLPLVTLGGIAAVLLLSRWTKGRGTLAHVLAYIGYVVAGGCAAVTGFMTIVLALEDERAAWLLVPLLIVPFAISSFWWMAAPTREGRRTIDRIEGFRQYLDIAEEDRLETMHPPERTPELFERYLPHAIALGVENAWAARFADVLAAAAERGETGRMRWYSGQGDAWRTPERFVGRVGTALAGTIASASTAPGSSSGSGGGGSSGGGGGGGGGGGW